MAFNESNAQRIRDLISGDRRFSEKRMFGGIGFLLYGNMCVGIWKDSLILRIGIEQWEEALAENHVHEFDITGRSMKGWVMVAPDGFDLVEQLQKWIDLAIDFTKTLPPKT